MKNKILSDFHKKNLEFPLYILEEVDKFLPKDISDKDIKKVLENVCEEYEESKITPYEAIGIITAQSVGEPSTQMALNTFHFAGVSSKSIQGLPRLIEILDAKKNLESPMMKIFFKDKNIVEKDVKKIVNQIAETSLRNFSNKFDINIEEKLVKIELDLKKLKSLNIDIDNLVSCLDKKIKKSSQIEQNHLIVKATNSANLKDLMNLKELALNSIVFGIKGIKDVSILKEDEEYVVYTSGVAIRQVLNIDEIDGNRIYCNDFFEVLNVYGIEAARNVIISEILEVVKSQGLTINERHVLLLADVMTYTGELKGMTRYGIVGNKQNVLTRASFETPLKHLSKGALLNEKNKLNTITENVMTNQIVRVGTGIPKISVKERK